MKIIVDGVLTHYRDEGKGKVLLMLHGWGSDLTTFDNLATWARSKYRVIRVDLPGHGQTEFRAQNGWSLDEYISFIEKFLEKLQISKIHLIIGHSMGGRIAIKALGGRALNCDGLVLVSAHGIVATNPKNTFFKVIAKIGKVAFAPLPATLKDKFRNKLYKTAGVDDFINASSSMKKTFKKLVKEDLAGWSSKIAMPTLLIYGGQDHVTPPSFGQTYQSLIPKSSLKIFNQSGHYPHLEAFDEFMKEIVSFSNEVA